MADGISVASTTSASESQNTTVGDVEADLSLEAQPAVNASANSSPHATPAPPEVITVAAMIHHHPDGDVPPIPENMEVDRVDGEGENGQVINVDEIRTAPGVEAVIDDQRKGE